MYGLEYLMEPLMGMLGIVCIVLICIKVSNNVWEKRPYKDEFNRPTKNCFISERKKQFGIFSNSATNNSSMSYYTFIDKDEISFKFWDYDKYQLKNVYTEPIYFNFKCLASSGKTFETTATMYGEEAEVIIDEVKDVKTFLKLLQDNKSLRIIIKNGLTEYKFTLKRGNFNKIFKTINR